MLAFFTPVGRCPPRRFARTAPTATIAPSTSSSPAAAGTQQLEAFHFLQWEVGNVMQGCRPFEAVPIAQRAQFAALKAVEVSAYQYGAQHPAAAKPAGGSPPSDTVYGAPPTPACGLPAAVVVPVFLREPDDAMNMARLLDSFGTQTVLGSFHVILVDDASPLEGWWRSGDAASALAKLPRVVLVRHAVNGGAAAARDTGLAAALAAGIPYGVITDVDCVAAPNWVERHLAAQVELGGSGGLVCGVTRAASSDLVSRFHDLCGHLNPRTRSDGSVVYGTTCNMSIGLHAAHRLPSADNRGLFFDGTFPGASYEDIDLCIRNAGAGVPLRIAHDACVRHDFSVGREEPFVTLFRRFMRYGASEHLLFARHPALTYADLYGNTLTLRLDDE